MNKKDINGKDISNFFLNRLNNFLITKDKSITIVDITLNNDYPSYIYAKRKHDVIENHTPIKVKNINLNITNYKELIKYIESLNVDKNINGIMIQLPLPSNLKEHEREILDSIALKKDVDGLTSANMGLLTIGSKCFVPCTALGIITIFKIYQINLENKKVAILNRSNIIGKPLFNLLLKENALPIICHSKIKNIKEITKSADIVIAALNKEEIIDNSYIKKNAIVIDVGVHNKGKIIGDVNYNSVYDKVSLITPPINSIGPMTICMLAYNTAKTLYYNEIEELLKNSIRDYNKIDVKTKT